MSTDAESFESEIPTLKDEPGTYKRFMTELALADKDSERWKQDAKYTTDRYSLEIRDSEDSRTFKSRFPLLWSNIQTLQPAVYISEPNPDISRRFKDKDPVGRLASMALERCGYYLSDRFKKHEVLKDVRDDYLIVGIGQARAYFEPTFYGNDLAYAYPFSKYVHYADFQMSPARTWDEVRWVAFKSYMSRDELKERFGKRAANTQLTQSPKDWNREKDGNYIPQALKQAEVWELWYKPTRTVYWFSPGKVDEFLDIKQDPLGLEGFFPCPKPVLATCSKNSVRPIPDFMYYKDQARDIDILTQRISALERMIRFAGVHNAAIPEIGRLATESIENRLVAASNWQLLVDAGGLKGTMDILPIQEMADVLVQLYQARDAKIQDVYQITGISDIIRGEANPQETATASKGKIQFATLRLQDRQDLMANFGRDLLEIELEIASKHLPDEIFTEIAGVAQLTPQEQELWPEALALIRNDLLKNFRIDIETDSTIAMDEEAQKNQRIELLNSTGIFIDKVAAAAQTMPDMVGVAGEILSFAIRTFKQGRTLESTVEAWVEDTKQAIEAQKAEPPPPPPPDPAVMKVQADAQAKQGEMQLKSQELQLKAQELQLEARKVALEEQKLLLEREKTIAELEFKREEMQLKAEVDIQTATINDEDNRRESDTKLNEIIATLQALQPKVTEVQFTTDEMGNKKALMVEQPINGAI